jgi:hypothetical protein
MWLPTSRQRRFQQEIAPLQHREIVDQQLQRRRLPRDRAHHGVLGMAHQRLDRGARHLKHARMMIEGRPDDPADLIERHECRRLLVDHEFAAALGADARALAVDEQEIIVARVGDELAGSPRAHAAAGT